MRPSTLLHGRIRIPGLTPNAHPPAAYLSLQDSISTVTDFLREGAAPGGGGTVCLTGAGVSVDSGIRAYRGKDGSYTINKKHRPIFFNEFIEQESKRRRYWARSYLGYPPVRVAESNPTHYAIGALLKMGYITSLITQNVDGLHHKAHDTNLTTYLSPSTIPPSSTLPPPTPDPPILELHGTLRHAHCLSCDAPVGRDAFQDRLSELNPAWAGYLEEVMRGERSEKLNPDGDVELGEGVRYEEFVVPSCERCGGDMKPRVTFFGESLSPSTRSLATHLIAQNTQLLIIGSSLATFSAFRLVKAMKEAGGRVGLLNVGESRGDPLCDWRVGWEGGAGEVLPDVARRLLGEKEWEMDMEEREEVERMLRSGVVKKVGKGGPTT
ncbi:DHS-like NAD/FAD-binding domain-containing protein [Leucosporidium creatinivorum]|uniref:DHS-like NAD/FAD-binding domain-containing protein n=1 Tax=Leucosporidium creatinivorum TaxID=106004 RepID=A0A1Y2FTQ6_9BASI|nr:DHS-like NAD/FAD-binding domain-containing protein [Leucosporidium creatinivorum]